MNQQQQPPRDESYKYRMTNEREQDARDYSARCQHNFQTWSGNPMVNMCRCGEWHWKRG